MSSLERHAMGRGGNCYCPKCNYTAPHKRGVPCQEERCPNCGTKLIREGSYHDELIKQRRNKRK